MQQVLGTRFYFDVEIGMLGPKIHEFTKSQEIHYEKYYTGSPKSGKDYRLFVEKLEILRRK